MDNKSDPSNSIGAGLTGVFTVMLQTFVEAFKWYGTHVDDITKWIVHFAQIGGLIVLFFTIRILYRNWKTGSKTSTSAFD